MGGLDTYGELERRVKSLYQDKEYGQGITLMTGHKAKGLEAETVVVLAKGFEESLSRTSKGSLQYIQAYNLAFVAYSRCSNSMFIVD